jgi:hypothetical protein
MGYSLTTELTIGSQRLCPASLGRAEMLFVSALTVTLDPETRLQNTF